MSERAPLAMAAPAALLSHAELDLPVIFRLRERARRRLEALRRQNDNPALGAEKTAQLRGRIEEVKETLATLGHKDPGTVD